MTNASTPDRRLLLVHAHPDDESSQSSATMARYVHEGAQVTLVTCTLGELGEILVPEWQSWTPEQLGEHRKLEIAKALQVVGVTDHVYLGGACRYHDSGMEHDAAGNVVAPAQRADNAFWDADLLEAADHLVEIIRSRRPQVVITYDPHGNYGHPDHVQAHRVTTYAVALAAAASHRPDLGEPWQVQRQLWNTHNTSRWSEAHDIAISRGIELWPDEDAQSPREFGVDPRFIAAVVETKPWLKVCREALGAHRSQVDPADPFWQFYSIMQELPGSGEAYLLGGGQPFPDADEPASDLFAGLAT